MDELDVLPRNTMHHSSFTFIAILLTLTGGFSIADPVQKPANPKSDLLASSETRLPDLKIRVFLEKDGKPLDSFESHHVGYDADSVKCVGVASPSADCLWRFEINADLGESKLSSIFVTIEDLKRFTKGDESSIIPIVIYTSCVSAKGIGTYEIGRAQGITIKVEISKEAEQAGTGQPATRPESKSEGKDKPQPDAEGRSR